jgi:putative zinc finger protein
MKCEWVQENILLYVYNELPDDARYELEQHVTRCTDCAAELKATRQFHATLSKHPVEEPSPNLLTSSRMRLQEALETAEQGGWWQRFIFEPAAWLRQIQFSPALAAVIFIVGFAGGIGVTYKMIKGTQSEIAREVIPTPATESSITGIQSISQEPGSNQINIKYNTVSTQEAQGSLNDQRIQQLLLYAARNNFNSGVRMDSVDLLTQKPNDAHIRELLLYTLQNDSNPGVRLKSLGALGSSVKDDVRVRDAVLSALVNDSNAGVRTEAMRLIEPVKADSSVRAVLTTLSAKDQSVYIRSQARTMLAQLPEID